MEKDKMGKDNSKNTGRKHFNIPRPLLEQVEKYQEEKGYTTLTTAFLELVRIGLQKEKEGE